MANFPFQTARAFGLFQGFCLVGSLWAVPASLLAQVTPSTDPLVATAVGGADLTPPKSGNIFDASPRIEKQELPVPRPSERESSVTEPSRAEGQPGRVSSQETEEEAEDIPTARTINQEHIVDRASKDSVLMNAIEQSRKLQRRLGVVSGPNGDKNTLDNLKKNIDKQEELKEEEQYRF